MQTPPYWKNYLTVLPSMISAYHQPFRRFYHLSLPLRTLSPLALITSLLRYWRGGRWGTYVCAPSTGTLPRPALMRTSHSNVEMQILLLSIRTMVTRPSATIVGVHHSFLWVVRSWPRWCFIDSLTASLSQCCLNRSVDLGRIGAWSTWSSQPGSFKKSVRSMFMVFVHMPHLQSSLWVQDKTV